MKPLYTVAIALVIFASNEAFGQHPSVDGVLGLKWGESQAEVKRSMAERGVINGGILLTQRPTDTLIYEGGRYGDFKVYFTELFFSKDRFFQTNIILPNSDSASNQFSLLYFTLERFYGTSVDTPLFLKNNEKSQALPVQLPAMDIASWSIPRLGRSVNDLIGLQLTGSSVMITYRCGWLQREDDLLKHPQRKDY